jgi:hypothetical protein
VFTNKQFVAPIYTGDPKRDFENQNRAIAEYLRSLETPKTLGKTSFWMPVASFATAGDSSWTPSVQFGAVTTFGPFHMLEFRFTASVTHTTAAGNLQITGLELPPQSDTDYGWAGACFFAGITKANYTQIAVTLTGGSSVITFTASGSGQAAATIGAGDVPTGGTLSIRGTLIYR